MRLKLLLPLILLLPLTAGACAPADIEDGHVVVSGYYTLRSDKVLDGDLVVFSGTVVAEEGTRIDGDVIITSGDVTLNGDVEGSVVMTSGILDINGSVEGSVFATSGDIMLGPDSYIGGDLANLGGDISRAPGATVKGNEGSMSLTPVMDVVVPTISPWQVLAWLLFRAIIGALVAMLLVALWYEYVARTANTATSAGIPATATGCLTLLLGIPLLTLLAITCCLIPISIVAALVIVAAGFLGWAALGLEIGNRLGGAFDKGLKPWAAAGLGTFVLTVTVAVIEQIPCVGWLAAMIIYCLAIGAALLTRFGTRDYPSQMPSAAGAAAPLATTTAAPPAVPTDTTTDTTE